MSIATCLLTVTPSPSFSPHPQTTPKLSTAFPLHLHLRLSSASYTTSLRHRQPPFLAYSTLPGGDGGDINNNNNNNNSGGGGGNNDNGRGKGGDENAGDKNREEAMVLLAEAGRSVESLPKDLAVAIQAGRIPGSVIERFLGLEKSGLMRWLMQFGGFKERLLADDLFLAKVAMECGVGIFTKTAAEYERRRENFFKELEIVFADVVMAIIADFMLVYLPAPTVSLRPPLAVSAGAISKFFYSCPDNAFQVALHGTSYSLLQRLGAVMRNGAKLFAVGTTSSLVGTAVTNALINARKAVDKSSAAEVENVPILSTSVAYGVYMAVSSNLRYQVLAGVIEQRILEPLLHQHKLMLSAICFAVRTGNTYLGSLLWVDYARLVGIQKAHEENTALE
ncbi:LOW QUALITY PROTEIN: protein RETICULATA-RELATED 4, chloroplastic-like [Herrania umbratica]|uniref:LOW QUALITY PROTEIN: protein RETICULATA-RELATED 4, chloroplastic-like n=1 Tax=Herrania umbratica TaxID=108875 RepID=A0A6J0ZVZ3_9ROSI|nr:LOW QUALITY PROTEIN: protein RETICULATA-RELATED 4, chloroplastic-like [Herrania umbratica]